MNFVVVGSLNMDFNFTVERLPEKGETVKVKSFNTNPGGKGANQAVTIARLGGNVFMVGTVGNDDNGNRLLDTLENFGLDIQGVTRVKEPTGNAFITVDEKGDNTLLAYAGANNSLTFDMVEKFKDKIEKAAYLVMQLEIPFDTVTATLDLVHQMGIKVILNPAPARRLPDDILPKIDILTPNETELCTISGREIKSDDERIEVAQSLVKKGVGRVVVTLGDRGCLYVDRKTHYFIESFKVTPVDTTAAGDSFNGGLAVALTEGKSMKEALSFANAVGALAVTKPGAQESIPERKAVELFLKSQQ